MTKEININFMAECISHIFTLFFSSFIFSMKGKYGVVYAKKEKRNKKKKIV